MLYNITSATLILSVLFENLFCVKKRRILFSEIVFHSFTFWDQRDPLLYPSAALDPPRIRDQRTQKDVISIAVELQLQFVFLCNLNEYLILSYFISFWITSQLLNFLTITLVFLLVFISYSLDNIYSYSCQWT